MITMQARVTKVTKPLNVFSCTSVFIVPCSCSAMGGPSRHSGLELSHGLRHFPAAVTPDLPHMSKMQRLCVVLIQISQQLEANAIGGFGLTRLG